MPQLTFDKCGDDNDFTPPRPQTAIPSFGGSRRSPRTTNSGSSPRVLLSRLTLGSGQSSRSNSNGKRSFFGGGKGSSTTSSPKACPDSPIVNSRGFVVESESSDGGGTKYDRQCFTDIADNTGVLGSSQRGGGGKMEEINALKRNLEVAMTTIVQLQAQLGQSHLKVEQLLKQKQELMALCQDHSAHQVDNDNNLAVVTNVTAPLTSCSPLITPSVQHDDNNSNTTSDDVIVTNGSNGITTTTTGTKINEGGIQTILDEMRLLLQDASKERCKHNLQIQCRLKQLNVRQLPSEIHWPSTSTTSSLRSEQPTHYSRRASRRSPRSMRPSSSSLHSLSHEEEQQQQPLNNRGSSSSSSSSTKEYEEGDIVPTLSRPPSSRRSPKIIKSRLLHISDPHHEKSPSKLRGSDGSDDVGFAFHHATPNQEEEEEEEGYSRTTMSLSCSTDFEQDQLNNSSSYNTKMKQHERSTYPGYESEATHPPQGMRKNSSCCYHDTAGYDEKRNSDDSSTVMTDGCGIAPKRQKDDGEDEEED